MTSDIITETLTRLVFLICAFFRVIVQLLIFISLAPMYYRIYTTDVGNHVTILQLFYVLHMTVSVAPKSL